MIKYFFKLTIVFLLAGLYFYFADIKSVSVNMSGSKQVISVYTILWIAFAIVLLAELVFLMFKGLVQALKNDVLISNHTFESEKDIMVGAKAAKETKMILSHSQFDEAAILIVKAMGSISSDSLNEARRHLVNLRKIIGNDAILDILMLKIYKAEKNFDKMEQISQKLMQNENIQLVGMKAALEAQIGKKEFTEALKTVNQAFEVRQDLYWVISSAFLLRAQNNDWMGAMEVLDAGIDKNITPASKASRLRAVALYQLAKQAQKDGDKTKFFKFITQALQENNRLIPAALDLADYYMKNDKQVRKAEAVLYAIWSENPSYDVARAYLALFPKDTKFEKIQRMEKLALANTKRPSLNNLILAELYVDAKKYAKARTECNLFLLKNPATEKVALLLDKLEERPKKGKAGGIVDSIKSRISAFNKEGTTYPKDFQWVCANCGHVSDKWEPICPECGEIGRNYWHLYVDKHSSLTEEI